MGKALRTVSALFWSAVLLFVTNTGAQYVRHEWTKMSMMQVRQNMGSQLEIEAYMRLWQFAEIAVWMAGLVLVIVVWYLHFRSTFKVTTMSLSIFMLFLSGCSVNVVTITPPNYGITIDVRDTSNQATGNDFGSGELVNVTRVKITNSACAVNSREYCPDKLVAEVEGSPQSRIYTQDPNTGTSTTNQSLCFEAQGANGCVDFAVSAIIKREDARCYSNKMGVKPVMNEDGTTSRYHFKATPLGEALDTRMLQIASSQMTRATVDQSPLKLDKTKFQVFEEQIPAMIQQVYERTCITLTDVDITSGIQWDSPEIQATIDEAIIVENRLLIAQKQNEVAQVEAQGLLSRTMIYSETLGLDAALRLAAIEKWDGSYMPPYHQAPVVELSESTQVSGTVAAK